MLIASRTLRALPLVVAVALLAGCHQASPGDPSSQTSAMAVTGAGELKLGNGTQDVSAFGVGQSYIDTAQPVAMMTFTVCAEGGDVHIDTVRLKESENLTLVDWGVRDYPPPGTDLGTWRGTVLSDATFSQKPLTGECGSSGKLSELVISTRRGDGGIGVAHGLEIETSTGTLFAPFRPMLCPQACPEDSEMSLP